MRNLKKILALALALIMSLSLVTTAGAFSDDGEINASYNDAVNVLSDLGVFKGYSDGSFKPKDSITRAEVAAIIYRIVTADVTDTQAGIHSTWGMFTDVQDGAWYAGYVNYCANAKYVKGVGNGQFKPQNSVTGYEALAMILRAVGYDRNNEFTGSQWQVNTASIARERGVLKNVTEGLLGQAASRELVAEILFRSIIIPKVEFNTNTLSYSVKGEKNTIGYESFKLEEIRGVVTGNEYADLENTVTMRSGKTRMVVDGANYTLDYAEESVLDGWDAIGEEHSAYITNANTTSAKVLKMVKTDRNQTWSTLSDDGIGSASDFRDKTGLQRDDSAIEYYLNFNEAQEWTSDWRVKYVLTSRDPVTELTINGLKTTVQRIQLNTNFTVPDLDVKDSDTDATLLAALQSGGRGNYTLDANNYLVYTVEFRVNEGINAGHRRNIEEIFNIADKLSSSGYVRGEVYVGTTSLKDKSDDMSFKQFVDEYINGSNVKISGNERGNWLKVIDNDGDGQADLVLKVKYTMAEVVRAKDGKYGLDTEDKILDDGDDANSITRDDAVSEDTLALGDIVYYTFVDDVIRAWKAESASVKIDTVNRKDLKVTTTDGTEYTESGVHGKHVTSNLYNCGVVNMNGSATYDVYLDRGGYLALFTDSNAGDFKLIVDGWYNSTKSGVEYAARVYNDETGRQDVVDITRGGELFISNGVYYDGKNEVQNNDWRALKWLGGVNENNGAKTNAPVTGKLNGNGVDDANGANAVKTTVATLNGDGVIMPVDYASNSNTGRDVVMVATEKNAIPTSAASYDATVYTTGYSLTSTDTAYNETLEKNGVADRVEVRALSNTVYYLVYPRASAESGFAVERYVGYSSVPKIDGKYVEDVYAVATRQNRVSTLGDSTYYTANVVVVELTRDYKGFGEQVFIYNMPVATSSVSIEQVDLIHADGAKEENVKVDYRASNVRDYRVAWNVKDHWATWNPGLYYMYPTNAEGVYTIEKMSPADIAEGNYAVGWSGTAGGTLANNYVSVVEFDSQGVAYNMTEPMDAAGSRVYTLSYNDRGIADLNDYTAEYGNVQTYLGEKKGEETRYTGKFDQWDHTPFDADGCTTYWNQNRVLVKYDASGKAQYAISFADRDGDNWNLAKNVWEACRPYGYGSEGLLGKPADEGWGWIDWDNSRADAVSYAEFMLRWYQTYIDRTGAYLWRDKYNLTPAVLTELRQALDKNRNQRKDDAEIGALIDQIDAILGTTETYTVTAVNAADGTVLGKSAPVKSGETATVTITIPEGQTAEVTGGVLKGDVITVAGVTADTEVKVTFKPVSTDPAVTVRVRFVTVDADGAQTEVPAAEGLKGEAAITGTEAVITLTLGDYTFVSADKGAVDSESGAITVTGLTAGENVVTVTVKAKGGETSEPRDITVTIGGYVAPDGLPINIGGAAVSSLGTRTLADGKTLNVTADEVLQSVEASGGWVVLDVTGPNGTDRVKNGDSYTVTIPAGLDTVALTVKVGTKQQEGGNHGEGDQFGDIEPLNARARSGEAPNYQLKIYVGAGRHPAYVEGQWPREESGDLKFFLDDERTARVGASDTAGLDIWKIVFYANPSLVENGKFVGVAYTLKCEDDETGGEDEILPYKAIADYQGTYEFFGYGAYKSNHLTDEQVKAALAEALGIAADSITIDRTNGKARYELNNWTQVVTFKAVGDNSAYKTGELFKVTYNGTVLDYIPYGGGTVEGFADGGNGYIVETSAEDVGGTSLAVTDGKAEISSGVSGDIEYTDAVKFDTETGTGLVAIAYKQYKNTSGTWAWADVSHTAGAAVAVKVGATIQVVVKPSGASLAEPKTVGLFFDGEEIDAVERIVVNNGTDGGAFEFAVPNMTGKNGSVVMLTAKVIEEKAEYDVYLGEELIGTVKNDEDVTGKKPTVQTGLNRNDRVLLAEISGDKMDPTETEAGTKKVGSDGTIKFESRDFNRAAEINGKKVLQLYQCSGINPTDVLADNAIIGIELNGEKCDDLTYKTSYGTVYFPRGAVLTMTRDNTKKGYIVTVKEGAADAVDIGTAADAKKDSFEFTYTVGEKDAILGKAQCGYKVSLTIEGLAENVTDDGTVKVTNNSGKISNGSASDSALTGTGVVSVTEEGGNGTWPTVENDKTYSVVITGLKAENLRLDALETEAEITSENNEVISATVTHSGADLTIKAEITVKAAAAGGGG